jgi:hypothetical protein
MDDATIRRIIREKLRADLLPRKPPHKMWGGRGHGRTCAACDQPIGAGEVEFEIENLGSLLYFHARCHDLWSEEREGEHLA